MLKEKNAIIQHKVTELGIDFLSASAACECLLIVGGRNFRAQKQDGRYGRGIRRNASGTQ
jgi:hypothetical protein